MFALTRQGLLMREICDMHPLTGFRVIDFTQSIAGPMCTQSLAALGAEVVKIEPPDGDAFRPLIDGAMYAACNRGKKSVCVDLKMEEGIDIVSELIADADVVVESFRPGVMNRLGLGYDSVREYNSDVIYCSVTGFGQTGPHASMPAYDPIAQAMSGLMAATGPKDGPPARIGTSAVDYTTGVTASLLITGALLAREMDGGGEYIDMSLFEQATMMMGYWVAHYTVSEGVPPRGGDGIYGFAPYGVYTAGDQMDFYLACASNKLFQRLCDYLELTELRTDERFGTPGNRWAHRNELQNILTDAFEDYSRDTLVEALSSAGIPAGPVQDVGDLVEEDPHAAERDLFVPTWNAHLEETCQTTRMPFRYSGGQLDDLAPPRSKGADTREILSGVGYSHDELNDLLAKSVLSSVD